MKSNLPPQTTKIVLPKSKAGHPRYFFRGAFAGDQPKAIQRLALVVDDDKAVRHAIKSVLERRLHLKVYVASNGAEGIRQARSHHFDLIISDVNMPIMDGIAFYDWLDKNQHQDVEKFMFVTGGNDLDTDIRAFRGGSIKVLDKPFALMDFVNNCNSLLRS